MSSNKRLCVVFLALLFAAAFTRVEWNLPFMLNFYIYNHSLFGAGIAVPSFSKANEERSSRFRVASPMTEIAHAMPPKQVTKTYPQSIRANLDNEHPTTLL